MHRLLPLLLLVVTAYSFAQPKSKVYKLRIQTKDGQTKKGYLRELNDSTLVISASPRIKSNTKTISYQALVTNKARDRKGLLKGVIFGATGGALIGAAIGYASYDPVDCSGALFCVDFGPEYDALGGAAIGAMAGALVGLAVGSASKEIQCDKLEPAQVRIALEKYLIH